MSVTCGFYNAKNHDRRYNSTQISSIFDGIINDGIYMSIGDHMVVKSNSGMMVTVGVGRAWFNHTWTLNDSLLPIEVPLSEIILNRIDAVVLEVNAEESVRKNTIKVIKGTPATNPARPVMASTSTVHQYPLAYIYVRAGVTEIQQSDITNMVGTSVTPFVTGIISTIDIDDLILKWESQWDRWFKDRQENANTMDEEWNEWFNSAKNDVDNAVGDANEKAGLANDAAARLNNFITNMEEQIAAGYFNGPQGAQGIQGPKGDKGDRGDSGIMVPASGIFTLSGDADGNLWACYADGDNPPSFEYNQDTGDVYYITPEE